MKKEKRIYMVVLFALIGSLIYGISGFIVGGIIGYVAGVILPWEW